MANTVTNVANIQILSTEDSTQNVLVNRQISPSLDVVFAKGLWYQVTPDTTAHALQLPLSVPVAKHFYMRNTGSIGTLLLTYTLVGGPAPIPAIILGPGDMFLIWQASTASPAVSGITQGIQVALGGNAFTVQGSAQGITYEWFAGA